MMSFAIFGQTTPNIYKDDNVEKTSFVLQWDNLDSLKAYRTGGKHYPVVSTFGDSIYISGSTGVYTLGSGNSNGVSKKDTQTYVATHTMIKDLVSFDNAKLWQGNKNYKSNEIFFFEAINGAVDAVGKKLKSPHGYFGRYLSYYKTPSGMATPSVSECAKIYTVSNGGSIFRDPVVDIPTLKQITNPSNGETRQVGTGSDNKTVFYTFNSAATIGESSNDGTMGKWIKTADPTKRILALANSRLGYENYNAGFTLTGDLENYQYEWFESLPNVTITHNDPAPSSGGEFEIVGQYRVYTGDDYINVNTEAPYRFVTKAKVTQASATGSKIYFGLIPYDSDHLQIRNYDVNYNGSLVNTLSQSVKDGDTKIHLTSAVGWGAISNVTNQDGLSLWPLQSNGEFAYKAASGRQYDELGYTKHNGLAYVGAVDEAAGEITLKKPWDLGSFAVGTKIAPNLNGGTYIYYIVGQVVPNDGKYHTYTSTWFTGEGKPQENNGSDYAGSHAVRNGTAYVKILGLLNYAENASSNVHLKVSIMGLEKGNASNVAVVKRVKFIGTANTFAGLPKVTPSGDVAISGDRAVLTVAEVGTGAVENPQYPQGEYRLLDDNTYELAFEISGNITELTDAEMDDYFEVKKGMSSPKQITSLITKKFNEKIVYVPDMVTAQATIIKNMSTVVIGNEGGIWRNESGADKVFSTQQSEGFNRKDHTPFLLLPENSASTNQFYERSGVHSYKNLDVWFNSKKPLPDYPLGSVPELNKKYVAVAPNNTANENVGNNYIVEAMATDVIPSTLNSTWWDDATKMKVVGKYEVTGSKFAYIEGGPRIVNVADFDNWKTNIFKVQKGKSVILWVMGNPANISIYEDFTNGKVTRADEATKAVLTIQGAVTIEFTRTGNALEILLKNNEGGVEGGENAVIDIPITNGTIGNSSWAVNPVGFDLTATKGYLVITSKLTNNTSVLSPLRIELPMQAGVEHHSGLVLNNNAYEIRAKVDLASKNEIQVAGSWDYNSSHGSNLISIRYYKPTKIITKADPALVTVEEDEVLLLDESSWGGSTNHVLLNGKTWVDIKNTYSKIRISAYSPRYTNPSEPVAWGYTVNTDVIKNGVNLFEDTDDGTARLRISDTTTGDIYNHSTAMAASDIKIYGVKKKYTVTKPTEAKVPFGLDMVLLKGTTDGNASEDITFTLPAGKELIGISSVLIGFNAGAVAPGDTGIISYNVMKKNDNTITIQGKTEQVHNKPYWIVLLIANQ